MSNAPPPPLKDPIENQPPPASLPDEPHIPVSIVPMTIDPLHASFEPPMPSVPIDSAWPSTSATPMETILIPTCDFPGPL